MSLRQTAKLLAAAALATILVGCGKAPASMAPMAALGQDRIVLRLARQQCVESLVRGFRQVVARCPGRYGQASNRLRAARESPLVTLIVCHHTADLNGRP